MASPTSTLSTGYTKAERRRLFPLNETLKIRSIKDAALHSYISIFGEKFDIRSCVKDKDPKNAKANAKDRNAEPKANAKDAEPKANANDVAPASSLERYDVVFTQPNDDVIPLESHPVTYQTRKEFDKLYLSEMDEKGKKLMRKLYMFIFGDQRLNTVTDDFNGLRMAFTNLSPYEKVPCHANTALLDALRVSIESRMKLLKEELKQLQMIYMGPNLNIDVKMKLLSNLTTFLQVLVAKKRHCILYSDEGGLSIKEDENLDWIYRFLKKHWLHLHSKKVPETPEERKKYYDEIRASVDVAKQDKQSSQSAYDDLIGIALNEYYNLESTRNRENKLLTKLKSPHVIDNINAVQNGLIVDGKPPPLQTGGDAEPKADDTIDDIREEIGRVIHTAMNHLKLLKASDREEALSSTLEILTRKGDSLEDAFASIHYEEPEWVSSTFAAIEYKLRSMKGVDPFLQAIKHILFLKGEELDTLKRMYRDVPAIIRHVEPGRDRFHAILQRHPSLHSVIPRDFLFQNNKEFHISLKHIEKELPLIYPYSNALLADIYAIEEGPTIRSIGESIFLHLFTTIRLPRKRIQSVINGVPDMKKIIEDILQKVDTIGPIDVDVSKVKELLEAVKSLPKEKLERTGPRIEVTVNEKVFVKPSEGKGASIGMLFFLYLFIKFANVLDESSDS